MEVSDFSCALSLRPRSNSPLNRTSLLLAFGDRFKAVALNGRRCCRDFANEYSLFNYFTQPVARSKLREAPSGRIGVGLVENFLIGVE